MADIVICETVWTPTTTIRSMGHPDRPHITVTTPAPPPFLMRAAFDPRIVNRPYTPLYFNAAARKAHDLPKWVAEQHEAVTEGCAAAWRRGVNIYIQEHH